MPLPLLVVILGPTASGKTALSLRLADEISGEIVSCDSVAVYREFEIGTAKPSREDRGRFQHHLIDVASPVEHFTAGEYARLARTALRDISERGHTPIVVGGTGLYLRALIEGLFPGPARRPDLRERLQRRAQKHGSGHLHRVLGKLDRVAAANIHANDVPKLIRAIEVCLASRNRLTDLWRAGRDPLTGFRVLRIGLDPDRASLYERINARAAKMFELGLMEETCALLQRYPRLLDDPASPLNALGYRQAVQCIRGELSREQAIAVAQQGHRNYAKRQMTWFRREPEVQWLKGFGDDAEILASAKKVVNTGG